ncbi:hypothetical protein Bca52824_053962 [Brassica carinata]|uniref:DNA polymerase alpha/delta/epsilon subunit B domain-containing protein n=1 Tax=Brassica carinata TaxID=52824 RepID=A0A8X7R714_BRACI|nr:hypothetical protein Bca52824_053962 [Brassica carinata]
MGGNCCNFVEFSHELITDNFSCGLFKIHAEVSEAIISSVNDPAVFFCTPPIICLFPRSTLYNIFRSCRNPHFFDVDNISFDTFCTFLGTYGKNINDLDKYSEAKSNLDFVERTLKWRHLAPTAPKTLTENSPPPALQNIYFEQSSILESIGLIHLFAGCYPFTDGDLFMIATCPHVFFVGSQDRYDNRLVKGSEGQPVRLIFIPKFYEPKESGVLHS